jgi:ribose transport system substrate-binding protein
MSKSYILEGVSKSVVAILVIVIVAVVAIAGVILMTGTKPAPTTTTPTPTGAKEIIVGFNVGAYGWPWRTQHIQDFIQYAEIFKAKGLIKDYYVTASGPEVSAQISDIRGLIQKGVNVLIINPNSLTGLNPVIEEANKAGIIVVATDQPIDSPYVVNVVIDHSEWFADMAEWVAQQLGGKGNIVIVTGISGHPANIARMQGAHAVLQKYPGIKVLAEIEGAWNFDIAMERMTPIIQTYRCQIDAVLEQDGHFLGVYKAFELAGIKPGDPCFPKIWTMDYTIASLKIWADIMKADPQFKGYVRLNPPGYSVDALKFAVRLAQGWQLNMSHPRIEKGKTYSGITVWLPLPPAITNDDVPKLLEEYKFMEDTYQIDYFVPDEVVDQYVIKPG